MAEVKGVSISATTVQSLKSEIKSLKDEISALILVDGDYQKKATELTEKQLKLSKATEVTKGAVIGVEKSYAQLVAQTNALRKEWRSVDMGSEKFKQLSEQINANNNRLKEMDKSIGDNFRNVGNYSEGFSQALSTLGSKFPSVQQGIMGVQKGFTLLSANPVLGTFNLIVTIIQKVVAVMKQSEEGTKALSKIMGVFDGVLTMVTKGFEFLGKGIAWVAEKITDLTKKWFKGNKVIEDNVSIQQKQIELEELHRKNLVESAKIENEISDLRAKASDKIKYSAKDRVAFLEKAVDKELKLSRMAQDEAQREYDLIVLKNAQTKSGTKDLEAEARAQAKVIQMQTEYNKKLREYNAQLYEARNAANKGVANKGAIGQTYKADTAVSFMDDIASAEADVQKVAEQSINEIIKGLEIATAERLRYAELSVQSESDKAKAIFDIQQQALLDEYALLMQGLDAKLFTDEEKIKAEKRVAQIIRDLAFKTAQEEQRLSKETADKKKRDQDKAVNAALRGAQAMSGILGSVADMYEADSEKNAASARKAKNLRIAGATIDMLSGITSAIAGLFTTKSGPWDIALATIQAASIAAAGTANIAKIRETDVSGNSAGGGAIVSAPAIVQQVPLTRTLTGVAEAEELNKSQRVYVVYDDIAEAGRKTEVTEQESTF